MCFEPGFLILKFRFLDVFLWMNLGVWGSGVDRSQGMQEGLVQRLLADCYGIAGMSLGSEAKVWWKRDRPRMASGC